LNVRATDLTARLQDVPKPKKVEKSKNGQNPTISFRFHLASCFLPMLNYSIHPTKAMYEGVDAQGRVRLPQFYCKLPYESGAIAAFVSASSARAGQRARGGFRWGISSILPSSDTAPTPDSNAATTCLAYAISATLGVKAALIAAT
jgi:hypothetical protein